MNNEPNKESPRLRGKIAWRSEDGQSYLYHSDCFEVMASMPGNSVDCIWTDPPYLLSNGGITCQSGRMVKVDKGGWDKSNGIELDHEFNLRWLKECHRVLKPNGTIWVSGTLHVYFSVGMALMQIGYRILNDIVWEKPAPPPNLGRRCFTHATEMLVWATKAPKKSKDRYTFNYDVMREENGGRQMKNLWRFSPPAKAEKQFGKHPTQKPVALVERCLRASTSEKDVVFDPFAGSSTTGVAAMNLRRRFIGTENVSGYIALSTVRLKAAGGESRQFVE